MTTATHLSLRWTVSKGRETYGYNIVTLTDTSTGEKFRAMGGGYDITGTVFGMWLEKNYQAQLDAMADRAYSQVVSAALGAGARPTNRDGLYGMRAYQCGDNPRVTLNGACGVGSMLRIAEALGLNVAQTRDRKARTSGFTVVSD